MSNHKKISITKKRYTFGLALLFLGPIMLIAFGFTGDDDFSLAKQQILLRKIGHEILLHSGDSTSRVLPIKKIADGQYQLQFEKEFTFQPDSLVRITRRELEKDDLAANYVVNVRSCDGEGVLFGYAIFKTKQDSLIPCSGRMQPKGCYLVEIKFEKSEMVSLRKAYLIGGFSLFAILGLLLITPFRIRKRDSGSIIVESGTLQVGNTIFDPGKRLIVTFGVETELTPKENKLFRIFAASPNTIIERSRLQKEIWEDEGVIVGRSLDVFVSKLRKKLESDQSIQIVNIHGKGYRLETNDNQQ